MTDEATHHTVIGREFAEHGMVQHSAGMVAGRTVVLTHIASQGAKGVRIASTYRRLQRFFQHVDLAPDWASIVPG